MKSLLKKPIRDMLQQAISNELYASALYKHCANRMQRAGYLGAAKFFLGESEDELKHYQRHVEYMNDMGDCADVPGVQAMDEDVPDLRTAVQVAYDTEAQLMQDYNGWYGDCLKAGDHVTARHLLFFLEVQQTSVGEYGDLLARLEVAGDNSAALLEIDEGLGGD